MLTGRKIRIVGGKRYLAQLKSGKSKEFVLVGDILLEDGTCRLVVVVDDEEHEVPSIPDAVGGEVVQYIPLE